MSEQLDPRLQKAVLARKGKADPRKAQGQRRRLVEKPDPGVVEPWWVQRARYLRLQQKKSYQAIADELDRPYRQVYKALNRKRVSVTDSASEKRNRARHTEMTLAARRARAPQCEVCGQSMNRPQVKTRVCESCRREAVQRDREALAELWEAGWTMREIGAHIGRSPGAVSMMVRNMRAAGWDLPRRLGDAVPAVSDVHEAADDGDDANDDRDDGRDGGEGDGDEPEPNDHHREGRERNHA